MLRVLSGAVILALAATGVSAADLEMGVPVTPPAVFTWSGCHVGTHLGALISEDTKTFINGTTSDYAGAGFLGGGQAGCDYQLSRSWLIGGEGRVAWSSLHFSRSGTVVSSTGVSVPSLYYTTTNFLASGTARLGYVYGGGRYMLYTRGGVAWTRDRYDDSFVTPAGASVDPSQSLSRTGWTIGSGVEWAFASQWSINAEYNYYDFGTEAITLTSPTVNIVGSRIQDRLSTATIGLNYHF